MKTIKVRPQLILNPLSATVIVFQVQKTIVNALTFAFLMQRLHCPSSTFRANFYVNLNTNGQEIFRNENEYIMLCSTKS